MPAELQRYFTTKIDALGTPFLAGKILRNKPACSRLYRGSPAVDRSKLGLLFLLIFLASVFCFLNTSSQESVDSIMKLGRKSGAFLPH